MIIIGLYRKLKRRFRTKDLGYVELNIPKKLKAAKKRKRPQFKVVSEPSGYIRIQAIKRI